VTLVTLTGSALVVYLVIFALAYVSATGIPVGAEAALIAGGALASGQVHTAGHVELHAWIVIVVGVVAEVAGSLTGYAIGRFGGRPLVDKVGKYILLTHKDLDRAEAWFDRRGEPLVFFGRFIPLLRSWISLAAGLGEMAITKFTIFTAAGCAIWCTVLTMIGYSLGSTYEHVVKGFKDAGYVLAAAFVVVVILGLVHRIRVVRRERGEGPQHARHAHHSRHVPLPEEVEDQS
jgi:membrane protein DedA with SNARE-associated domain